MPRNRNEFRFFLATVLTLGLIIGHGLSGYVVANSGSTYANLEIFSDALSIVQSEYVEEIEPEKLVYGALRGLMNELDPHSQFMKPDTYSELKVETEGHFGGLGIVISLDENKVLTVISPIEGTPAAKAGIIAGDKIIEIEGESSFGLVLEEAVKKLRGPRGSKVTIKVLRMHADNDQKSAEELDFTIVRDEIKIPSTKVKMYDHGIAHVRLLEFSESAGRDLEEKLKELNEQGMRSLVLDMRNNPGGLLNVAAEVADKFLEKGRLIVYTESRDSNQDMSFKSREIPTVSPDAPMVVLVNGGSASASEIVAGALRDHRRAVIMGEKTFGKGSVQSIIPLSDGSALRLTTAKYLTPNGHSINGIGIEPDIEVKITLEDAAHLFSGITTNGEEDKLASDPQLQRAIDLLQGYDIFKSIEQNINVAKANEPATEEPAEKEEREATGGSQTDDTKTAVPENGEEAESEQAPAEKIEE